jgi:hypothetical protein
MNALLNVTGREETYKLVWLCREPVRSNCQRVHGAIRIVGKQKVLEGLDAVEGVQNVAGTWRGESDCKTTLKTGRKVRVERSIPWEDQQSREDKDGCGVVVLVL